MSNLGTKFWQECEKAHDDHQAVLQELVDLEYAMGSLERFSQGYAALQSAQEVFRHGIHLCDTLPAHFAEEETILFTRLSAVSPELARFAREMSRQHDELRQMLRDFRHSLENLRSSPDNCPGFELLREQGVELGRKLAEHMRLEEEYLGGFL